MENIIKTEIPLSLVFTNPQDAEIGPREMLDIPVQEPIIIPGYENVGTIPDLSIDIPVVEQIEPTPEPTIYDKYSQVIKNYESGIVRDLSYANSMEILRYCERIIGNQIPINMSCNTCVFDLIKLFVNLKDK